MIIDNYTKERIIQYQIEYDSGKTLKEVAKQNNIWSGTLSKYITLRKRLRKSREEESLVRKNYRTRIKQKAVKYKGGKCFICGYDRCNQAMDFHHLDSSKKEFVISGGTRSFENIKAELDKCVLLCRNCHSEVHAGILECSLDGKASH